MKTKKKQPSHRKFVKYGIIMSVIVLTASIGLYTLTNSDARSSYPTTEKRINRAPAGSRKRIVLIAKQQLDYAEQPVNKVKYFDWAGDGHMPGSGPWCSVFATWVWHAAGVRLDGAPYPKQPGVAEVRDTGKRGYRFHGIEHARPGDLIIYGREGSDHIGVVERVSGKRVTVIEGNANLDKGGTDKVIRRKINLRKPDTIPHGVVYGFVSPPSR